MDVRARRSRETSPDRARVCMQPKVKTLIRKLQVVYYLSRNGQLEHPHYMEVFLSANHQQLHLKDVMDRLTALRGKIMPSLYSWSCKRSYKNGYVWNDLAENDIIYPTEGAEYVLKGSELIEEKFQQFHVVSNKQQTPEPNLHPKRKPLTPSRNRETEEVENRVYEIREEEDDDDQDHDHDNDEDEEKTSYSSSNTSHSRCSRGVSTDEIEEIQKNPTELTLVDHSSPPSLTSSSVSDKANESNISSSKRFGDEIGIVTTDSVPSRHSVLLQLIACGSSVGVIKGKKLQSLKQPTSNSTDATATKSTRTLHKLVICKSAAKEVTEDEMMISCMSMNPRFANLQSEEKEYFSGSIVESMTTEERSCIGPVLKRSNSYDEERSTKTDLGEAIEKEEEMKKEKKAGMKGKCMPRKKSTSSKQSRK